MRSLIDILDLSVSELDGMMDIALDIASNPSKYSEACRGKILATLFFEPSTRTRLSFEAAMMRLGGSVLSVSDGGSSSASKGESVADTAKIVSLYADIIAMRHPKEGAPYVASQNSSVPVINAGDGGHFHPTQTLADLLTIRRVLGRTNNITVGFCGDLKYGRTVHSLIAALSRYEGIKLVLISPDELKIPEYVKEDFINGKDIEILETRVLESSIPELDVLYMTRIQRERFSDKDEYERLKDSYVLKRAMLENAKETLCIMHPLPRVNEISVDVDEDSRAHYFNQAQNGMFMRMALILMLLGLAGKIEKESKPENFLTDLKCHNPRCITSCEQEIVHKYKICDDGTKKCIYCDSEVN